MTVKELLQSGGKLTLGSVVRSNIESFQFGDSTVKTIHANGEITFFRPYVHHADFSWGSYEKGEGGTQVICYLGFEEWTCKPHQIKDYKVVHIEPPLK